MEISKKSAFLVVVLLGLGWGLALAEEVPSAQENPLLKPAAKWQYGEIYVYLKNGKILTGVLFGLEKQAVVMSAAQGRKAIPLADIDRVVIKTEKKDDSGLVFGTLMGLYAGNL